MLTVISNFFSSPKCAMGHAVVLWSYAKMGKRYEELLQAASLHAVRAMKAFQPQSVVRCFAVGFRCIYSLASQSMIDCPNAVLELLKSWSSL
jgi:hypothetical protein